jgi:hypothetical protein
MGGAISAMNAGATMEEAPTPGPPMKRIGEKV